MTEPIPVLTLWQPWASLVAIGVKTIETRSWTTKYRGRIAIHAGVHWPELEHIPKLWSRGATHSEQDEWNKETWLVISTITDPAFHGPQPQGKRIPRRALTPTLFYPHSGPHGRPHVEGTSATEQGTAIYLPLGVIVATAAVVDVVPITNPGEATNALDSHLVVDPEFSMRAHLVIEGDGPGGWAPDAPVEVTDQLPYGDYTRGRFAWLLEDIEPLAQPVPFRGGQALSRRWEIPAATIASERNMEP